jgi:hypothetical protein
MNNYVTPDIASPSQSHHQLFKIDETTIFTNIHLAKKSSHQRDERGLAFQ